MVKINLLFKCVLFFAVLTRTGVGIAETLYKFQITRGVAAITPARNPANLPPTKTKLTGNFSAKLYDGKIRFLNQGNGQPGISALLADYKNGKFIAKPDAANFDNGYQGYFDGKKISLNGAVDQRPFDGSMTEYSLIAKLIKSTVVTEQKGYFKIRRDMRKCASPMCGGYFVKQVNKTKTQCADKVTRNECYVPSVDWGNIHEPAVALDALLIYGWLSPENFKDFGWRDQFTVSAAYEAAGDASHRVGKFFAGFKDAGIRCIMAPCPSIKEYVLNSSKAATFVGVNLDRVKTAKIKRSMADDILSQGGLLLAEGNHRTETYTLVAGGEVSEIVFVARQFYLPILSCASGYQAKNGRCETDFGCVAPKLEKITYGGAAFTDPVTGETGSNISRSCVDACDPPGNLEPIGGVCSVYAP
jgi:hypothetical protein